MPQSIKEALVEAVPNEDVGINVGTNVGINKLSIAIFTHFADMPK